jgi:hypothetical protein
MTNNPEQATLCRICSTPMQPGQVIAPTLIRSGEGTLTAGTGHLTPATKCPACGHSYADVPVVTPPKRA